ncbi:MAG TPA: hypothetical protein VLI06_09040 [Solimonas sp.]|nr:hypothetical protein [Solimonas sp.]
MPTMLKLLLRDLGLLALTLLAVGWSHQLQLSGSGLMWPSAILAGVLLTVVGYLGHEWGHLLGALAGGSRVELPQKLLAVFLFKFDSDRNNRQQFLGMSMGGFIASGLVLVILGLTLSMQFWTDRIALGLVVAGVIATFILEVPGAWRVYKGAPLPHGAAFVGNDTPA